MDSVTPFEIFCAAPPGLEPVLQEEMVENGFRDPVVMAGGVAIQGDWPDVWRANLVLRGATRVLARIGAFPAAHLAQLDKRARKLPWRAWLRPNVPVRVQAVCKRSRIYHSGAAAQRIADAVSDATGAAVAEAAAVTVMVRIERNRCVISLDTSGELLHKRGFKTDVTAAPLRETLAALYLRQCGYRPGEALVDPMCGSGTFVLEAAERAAGLAPGRGRAFAFERLATFDEGAWRALKTQANADASENAAAVSCFGLDRDAEAIRLSEANAERAGVAARTRFQTQPVSALIPPPVDEPGLVIVNPPYGARLGKAEELPSLYSRFGQLIRTHFVGWRVGLVTTEQRLAKATGLPFDRPGPPVPHGALKVRIYRTKHMS